MIKIFCYTFLVCGLIACSTTRSSISGSGNNEKDRVGEFLHLMTNGLGDEDLRQFISPKFAAENEINLADYYINVYLPEGYEVKSWDSARQEVVALIWGEGKSWTHRLHFKVVDEDGKFYFIPAGLDEEFIDPWFKVETYIGK